jgi:ferredoxin
MGYVIDATRCINCGLCRFRCPTETVRYFSTGHRRHEIDLEWCIDCDICAQVCPVDCIEHHPELRPAPDQLERAKERARSYAAANRRVQSSLREYVAATIARLEERTASR